MTWLIVAFISGLLLGGLAALIINNQYYSHRLRKLEIELTEAEATVASLKEINLECLNHASQILTRWIDYRREHGTEEDYY